MPGESESESHWPCTNLTYLNHHTTDQSVERLEEAPLVAEHLDINSILSQEDSYKIFSSNSKEILLRCFSDSFRDGRFARMYRYVKKVEG